MSDLVPQLIGGRWVSAELSIDGATVLVRVGISVHELGELLGDALAVQVVAGEEALGQLSAPDPGSPLLCVSTAGGWAWAEYTFRNPRGLIPTAILVTFEGQTASFDLRDAIPTPPPPAPRAAVGLSVGVLRPDDLLDLVIDTVNLRLDTSQPELPVLVREVAGRDALLIVRFAPQTLVEEAFFEAEPPGKQYPPENFGQPPTPATSSTVPAPGAVAARLGEQTRLVFRVPDGVSIPYSTDGLLDWSRLQLVVAPIAAVKPGEDPGPDALSIRPPQPTESTLQLPYRLHLSPSGDVAWDHSRSPVIHGERAELWHTRLCTRTSGGEVQPTDALHAAPLRAIWSPDYTGGPIPSPGDMGPFGHLAAMSGYDRHQIVVLTSAFRGYAADEFTAFVPMPVEASLLMLSSLGGWLRSVGYWDPPYRVVQGPWRQLEAPQELSRLMDPALYLSRETRQHGPRAPLGLEGDRGMAGPDRVTAAPDISAQGRVAPVEPSLIDARQWLRFPRYERGEQLDLSQWAHIASQGRDHYVRIVYEGQLKELGHRAALVKVTERRFEQAPSSGVVVAYLRQYMYIVVREPEKNYEQEGLANDGRGMPLTRVRLTTLVTPHIDYPYPDPVNPANDPTKPHYNPAAITDRSFWVMVDNQDFRFHAQAIDVAGNVIDFTKPLIFVPDSEVNLAAVDAAYNDPANRERRAAAVPGQIVTFAPADPGNQNTSFATEALNFANEGPDREHFFKPRLFSAGVHIPAIEHLTGRATVTTLRLADPYLNGGFGDPGNATGAFAEIVSQDDKGVLQTGGLDVQFNASQAGGFATPHLDIKTLTRAAGPLGSELNDALANHFDPAQVFKTGARLFGVFELAALLPAGDADRLAPTMQVAQDATTVVTSLEWQTEVQNLATPGELVQFLRNADTRLDVKALIRNDLTGALAGSSTLTGKLDHFSIAFFKVLQLNFASFSFSSQSGKKTDANVGLDAATPVQFRGDLEFVEGLRKLIPPGVFGDGVSIDLVQNPLGVHAGVGIGLPPANVGIFALKNIAFSAGLTIPFLDGNPVANFAFARRDNPFLLAVALLGGGGFFHIELDTNGIRILEASFEFAAAAALDIGVASGEVHIMAGIYFKMEKRAVAEQGGKEMMVSSLTGYLRCGGSLSVLGLVTVSVEFYLAFTYHSDAHKATGSATLTVEVDVACFSKSISLTVERSFGAEGGDPTFGQMIDTPQLWSEYAAAFA